MLTTLPIMSASTTSHFIPLHQGVYLDHLRPVSLFLNSRNKFVIFSLLSLIVLDLFAASSESVFGAGAFELRLDRSDYQLFAHRCIFDNISCVRYQPRPLLHPPLLHGRRVQQEVVDAGVKLMVTRKYVEKKHQHTVSSPENKRVNYGP